MAEALMAEATAEKLPAHLREDLKFKPGQSGNPHGRPKGSRNKLGEAFVADLLTDWEKNGIKAIEDMRAESPTAYCKVIASVIPKEVNLTVEEYDRLSDDDLAREFNAIAQRLAAGNRAGGRDRAKEVQGALPH